MFNRYRLVDTVQYRVPEYNEGLYSIPEYSDKETESLRYNRHTEVNVGLGISHVNCSQVDVGKSVGLGIPICNLYSEFLEHLYVHRAYSKF